jgi:Pyruvate/2-oxoglutarate dehydrogenase complex, dehydrogenase (E1) component, eukaryotic type, alpha subunit
MTDARELFRWMVVARTLGTTLCTLNVRWFPLEGEEAVHVGSFADLRPDDAAAPHYRDPFVVYLMRGAELWRLVAQVLGKSAGYSKGRSVAFNGPFHLNIVPWVAGDLGTTIGTATGAALAFKQQRSDQVCVCSFGDGTANRGDFHENINLAAIWRLPIVYVCQNNGWAISQRADSYLPAPVAARAAGYGIPARTVDGQDVEAVRAVVAEAIDRARRGKGPTLIDALTYRRRGHWAGHIVSDADGAGVVERPDPIDVLRLRLLERGLATDAEIDQVHERAADEVAAAVERAKAAADVGDVELGLDDVFA